MAEGKAFAQWFLVEVGDGGAVLVRKHFKAPHGIQGIGKMEDMGKKVFCGPSPQAIALPARLAFLVFKNAKLARA